MDRGFDSFRQLQAQLATQLAGALRLPSSKAIAVQLTLAAVVAAGVTQAPEAQAGGYPSITQTELRNWQAQKAAEARLAQEAQGAQQGEPGSEAELSGKGAAIGAGAGAFAGNLLGKFTNSNRKVTTVAGAAIGGFIGAVKGGRDKAAEEAQRFQQHMQKFPATRLSPERDQQMAALQVDALGKRITYVTALKAAKEAEIDKSLMPADKDVQIRYHGAVIEATKALREDRAASSSFTRAFRAMQGQYNVAEYAPAFAKLSRPAQVGDTTYGKLWKHAFDTLEAKQVSTELEGATRSNDRLTNTMF